MYIYTLIKLYRNNTASILPSLFLRYFSIFLWPVDTVEGEVISLMISWLICLLTEVTLS